VIVEDTGRTYLPLRRVDFRIAFAFVAIVTICLSVYRQLNYVAGGEYRPFSLTCLEESVGGLAGFAIFPLGYLVAIHFPLLSPAWRRNLAVHLICLCGISIIHTTLIIMFRALLFPLFGYGNVSYGYLPVRYPMEFAHLFIFYWVGVSLIYLFHEIRFRQQREIRQARLEASLAEAQLRNLRLQLEPHFLFNALNAISAAIYEDPRAADEMIGRLSELLRQLLKSERSQEIPLARELELLELYTGVMRARFEDRLSISFRIDEELKQAMVPQLILQPLVENAIRHGMDPATCKVDVVAEGRREGDMLVLTVRDKGPGLDLKRPLAEGVGLRNTRERLARLYGERQSCRLGNVEEGGALVALRFPLTLPA
jgi:two-component system, LytTR family, sensor kinase